MIEDQDQEEPSAAEEAAAPAYQAEPAPRTSQDVATDALVRIAVALERLAEHHTPPVQG